MARRGGQPRYTFIELVGKQRATREAKHLQEGMYTSYLDKIARKVINMWI
jgi:hypothetical protein